MACYHPNSAYIAGYKPDGTKIIKFGTALSEAVALELPCGQCIGCRLAKSIEWAVRCMHEAQINDDNNCFITLTYNDENLPHDGSLVKEHFQKFIKSLRKRTGQIIRYYHCGEYGDNLQRPHYHALIFGYDFPDLEVHDYQEGIYTYTSELLEKTWGRGFCTVQDLTIGNAAYAARYTLKKINGAKKDEHYQTTDPLTGELRHIEPEYSTMSRRPGIARDWFTKYHSDIFPNDTTIYKGRKIKTPRYYENLLRSADPTTFNIIKAERKTQALKHAENNTDERLATREKVQHLKLQQQTERKLHK